MGRISDIWIVRDKEILLCEVRGIRGVFFQDDMNSELFGTNHLIVLYGGGCHSMGGA